MTAPGTRLHRLELLNWGPFDRRVWQLPTGGAHTLLTGDLGTGSTAVVDALRTLLPTDGAAADLRPLVRGHWRTERDETTGGARPVALRPGTTWSAVLAVFGDVTVGRVLWLRAGADDAPQQFSFVADGDLSIAGDLSGFGGDPLTLARRLAAREDVVVCTDPAEYARVSRARLGLDADGARLLAAATPAGDLAAVVREQVLGAADVGRWVDRLAGSVEDLTRTTTTLTAVRGQLAALDPVLDDADRLVTLTEQLASVDDELLALPDWADRWRERLLATRATRLRAEVAATDRELADVQERLDEARDRVADATVERAGKGGDQLTRLETRLRDLATQRRERRGRADVLDRLLTTAGLDRVTDEHAFRTRREEVAQESTRVRRRTVDTSVRVRELDAEIAGLAGQLAVLEGETAVVRAGSETVPPALAAMRDRLTARLGVELPFAGELLTVTDPAWLPAATAVLGDLPGSLLVPAEHAAAVAAVADLELPHHVLPDPLPTTAPLPAARTLAAVVQVADCPAGAWLEGEVVRRAPHLRAHTDTEFLRSPQAVARDGRVKDAGGRRPALPRDPDAVLGWSSLARAATLEVRAELVRARHDTAVAGRDEWAAAHTAALVRDRDLARVELFADWRDVDWRSSVEAIAETKARIADAGRAPLALARIEETLADLRMDVAKLEAAQADALQRRGTAAGARDEAFRTLGVVRTRLGTDDGSALDAVLDHAAALLGAAQTAPQRLDRRAGVAFSPPVDTDDMDERERQLRAQLTGEHTRRNDAHARTAQQVVTGMTAFLHAWPTALPGVTASVAAVADVRALRDRLRREELPALAAAADEQLTERVVRDAASLLAELDRRADQVHTRVRAVDEVLYGLDVEPGRHLHLTVRASTSVEVAAFRAELRAVADTLGSRPDDDLVARVTALVARLTGDAGWAARVTDVRTWSVVDVAELWRADGTGVVASTKPGDRRRREETVAATVLVAAQLATRGDDGLRLLVLDRWSREVTRAALELGDRVGLQLLVVAPQHEIAALEPHLGAVAQLVDPDGNDARLRCLTVG
ncbi:ATP-binding protein [Modestobacter sp. Leaf380]|uniref:ATP-binding protein n=1 Tax=Modestobacter sp. Leaf380 TaxID=1736356 RepID=UPI0006FDF70D|nr:ATP-binding protein [Modestobacter sp. Leaf380]KQS67668.1 hypothetical protein ASG41_22555 [Modestobacter sp. Leaf380]